MQCSPPYAWFGFRVRLAQRELEYSMKTDEFAIPPMRCRWGVRAQLNNYCNDFHTPCGRPAVAAADLEGFAHSAAAEGARSTQACAHVHELSAK